MRSLKNPPPSGVGSINNTRKDWTHYAQFLDATDAANIYRRMLLAPWSIPDADSSRILYGLSYQQQGGGKLGEILTIPDFLTTLADRVADNKHVQMPSNYIQCRRMDAAAQVHPHRDPSGMIVPMLTLGQERTFRVGGTYPEGLPQQQRPVESHIPEEEIPMRHGDLLVFNGGRTAHSMFPADKDPRFNRNGFDFRISILFRWTTSIVRAMGPNRMKWTPSQVQEHEREYKTVRENFMDEHQAQLSLFGKVSATVVS